MVSVNIPAFCRAAMLRTVCTELKDNFNLLDSMVAKSFELAGVKMVGWELSTDKEVRLAEHLLYDKHFFIIEGFFFSYHDQPTYV